MCCFLGKIIFHSLYGSIEVHDLNQISHMSKASLSEFEFYTHSVKNISFLTGEISLYSLLAHSEGGINILYDVNIYGNDLNLTYNENELSISANVDFISNY